MKKFSVFFYRGALAEKTINFTSRYRLIGFLDSYCLIHKYLYSPIVLTAELSTGNSYDNDYFHVEMFNNG